MEILLNQPPPEREPFSLLGQTAESLQHYNERLDEGVVHGVIVPSVIDNEGGIVDFEAPVLFIPRESTGSVFAHHDSFIMSGTPRGPKGEIQYIGLFIYPAERLIVVDGKPVAEDRISSLVTTNFTIPSKTLGVMRYLFGATYRLAMTNLEETYRPGAQLARPYEFLEADDHTIAIDRLRRHAQGHADLGDIYGPRRMQFINEYTEIILGGGFGQHSESMGDFVERYAALVGEERNQSSGCNDI